jgi:hypothetical protein
MKTQVVPGKKSSFPFQPWWKSRQIAVMTSLTIACWVPLFIKSEEFPKDVAVTWGLNDAVSGQVTIDGTRLQRYQGRFRIAAVGFHYSGSPDVIDVTGLQKSAMYEIVNTAQIRIIVPFDQVFLRDWTIGSARGTNYRVLLVPVGINLEQFRTLREAYALGVKDIWSGGGPP